MRIMSQNRNILVDVRSVSFNPAGRIFGRFSEEDHIQLGVYSNWNTAKNVIEEMARFFNENPNSVYFMPCRCDMDY